MSDSLSGRADRLAEWEEMLASASVGWWSWNVPSGRTTWSANFEAVHGLAPGSLDRSFDSLLARIHPEDRQGFRSAVLRTVAHGDAYDLDLRVLPTRGPMQTVIARGSASLEAGGPVVSGIAINVSRRRALERDRRLLAAIVDSSDDAIVSKDLHGIILSWNRAAERMFGYTAAEAVGQSITILLPPEKSDDFFSIMGRIRRGERVEHYETLRRRKDGRILEVALTISPVRDEFGTVIGASKIARDITEAKAAERDRQRTRELFLGILGHDLRNPLNVISASLYAIRRELPEPAAARIVPRMNRATERMTRMIEQLLDFTRARLGDGIAVDPRPADLRDICAAIVEDVSHQQPNRIRFAAAGSLPGLWDSDRLTQALSNLISNALQHGSAAEPVEVRAWPENGLACVSVSNAGDPIAAEDRDTIFEPFRRLGAAPSRDSSGVGLGLYIAREIVRSHGGTIDLSSEPDRTSFLVRLPIASPDPLPT